MAPETQKKITYSQPQIVGVTLKQTCPFKGMVVKLDEAYAQGGQGKFIAVAENDRVNLVALVYNQPRDNIGLIAHCDILRVLNRLGIPLYNSLSISEFPSIKPDLILGGGNVLALPIEKKIKFYETSSGYGNLPKFILEAALKELKGWSVEIDALDQKVLGLSMRSSDEDYKIMVSWYAEMGIPIPRVSV